MLSRISRTYQRAYTGHPREIWLITIMTFLNRAGTMVYPFLAVYAKTVLGFTLGETGLVVASMGVGGLIGSYIGGILTDRIGGYAIIVYSMIIGGFCFVTIQYFTSLKTLMAVLVFCGVFTEAYRPAMFAIVGNYVPNSAIARSMALIRLAINIGFGVGTAVGGFIAATLGYDYIFWIDGITCILAGLFFLFAMSPKRQRHKEPSAEEKKTMRIGSVPPYKNKKYLIFCLGTLLLGTTFIQWFHTIPTFIKDEWFFDERYIGILFMVNTFLIAIVELPIIEEIERAGRVRKAMRWGLFFIALSFMPFLFDAALIWMYVAMLFLTIGEILYLPLNTTIAIILSDKTRRGEYMSYYSMTWSITHVGGPLIGFTIADAFGFSALWVTLFFLSLIGLYFFKLSKT